MNAILLVAALAAPGVQTDTVPLYDNLGDHHSAITTAEPKAQAYFDQGIRLYYAFNHQEAIRSFRAAQRLDPDCAMCWWGEALAWGPNINLPMDSASGVAAHAAVRGALKRLEGETARERALVEALAVRYAEVPPADRAALDSAYARAMAEVARSYPDDPEASVLYAESLMDLRPWNYWTAEKEPQPGMSEALSHLESVIASTPDHPGACHFFIHAVEAAYPERAVDCAERLADAMPGAGHLVHMPGHIYIRVGRYADAIKVNEHAVHADESYIQDQRPTPGMYTAGYYPHNYDFMAFGAAMAGRSDMAVSAAEKVAALIPEDLLASPDMSFLQHWLTRHYQLEVRFGQWDALLDTPAPPSDLLHATAMWHYARGRALAASGRVEEARTELDRLSALSTDTALDGVRLEFNEAKTVLAVATDVLAGRIAAAAGDMDEAVARLTEAARAEDAMVYGEPPEWTVPVRHDLGAVLLDAGRAAEAEAAFREDLDRFPENGWSLRGLALALRAQGRTAEAEEVEARLAVAWREADVTPPSSAF